MIEDDLHKIMKIHTPLLKIYAIAKRLSCSQECPHCKEIKKLVNVARKAINDMVRIGDDAHNRERLIPIITKEDEMKERYEQTRYKNKI